MINLYAEVERFDPEHVDSTITTIGPFSPEDGLEDDPFSAEDALRDNLEARGETVVSVWSIES